MGRCAPRAPSVCLMRWAACRAAWDRQLRRATMQLFRGLRLADEMGLGKTIQAIAVLLQRAGPALVVAPTSVLANWATKLARFAPSLRTVVLRRAASSLKTWRRRFAPLRRWRRQVYRAGRGAGKGCRAAASRGDLGRGRAAGDLQHAAPSRRQHFADRARARNRSQHAQAQAASCGNEISYYARE